MINGIKTSTLSLLLSFVGMAAIGATDFAGQHFAASRGDLFDYPVAYAAGSACRPVVAGDFNLDGHPDLVAASTNDDIVSVYLNAGDGTFPSRVDYPAGDGPWDLCTADFDGDGDLDFAAAIKDQNSVRVFFNDGSGQFTSTSDLPTGTLPLGIAAARLNDDNAYDLVTSNWSSADVSVLLNNGGGAFQVATSYSSGSSTRTVAIADVDENGTMDVVVTNTLVDSVTVLKGAGDGTLLPAVHYSVGEDPHHVCVANIRGTDEPDLIVSNYNSVDISVLENAGDGTFLPEVRDTVGGSPCWASANDFDGDGLEDLVVSRFGGDVVVFLNDGDSAFAAPDYYNAGGHYTVCLITHNVVGSNAPDIVTANDVSNNICILENLRVDPVVWHVSVSGSDSVGDGSSELPYATIQYAIDQAFEGDTILVHDGTYTGDGNRDIDFGGTNLVLMSENGPEFTIIDCEGSISATHRAFRFASGEDSTATVIGLTMRNGYAPADGPGGWSDGGAILCYGASPSIVGCVITANEAAVYGGGIFFEQCSPIIEACIVSENTAGYGGGGIFAHSGTMRVHEVKISQNHGSYGAGIWSNFCDGMISHCVVYDNNSDQAGGALRSNGGSLVIQSCTFSDNSATTGSCLSGCNQHSMTNCIISFGHGGPAMDQCSPQLSCCDIYGNEGGDWIGGIADQYGVNNNISVDPLFCDTLMGNYHLQSLSPCQPDSSACGLYGALGVGCFGNLISSLTAEGEVTINNITSHNPVFVWSYDLLDGFTQASFELEIGSDEDWDVAEMWEPGEITSTDTSVSYAGDPLLDGETYFLRLRLSDGENWTAWYHTSFRMNSVPSVPVTLRPVGDEVANNPPTLWLLNSTDAEGDALVYDFHGIRDTDCVKQAPIEAFDVPEGEDSTHYQVEYPLDENCHYWWQARAYDGYEYSEWTELLPNGFYVDGEPEPPTSPTPNWPPDTGNMPVFEMLPTFTWGASHDPDPYDSVLYRLEIAIDPEFSFVNETDSIASSEYTLEDSLNFDTQYWWRVSAFDKTGLTTMSEYVKDFWTWTLGDLDHNHSVDIADLVLLVNFMFNGGQPPYPLFVADIDGNCTGPDIADLVYLVNYMFNGGPGPGVGCD